MKVGMMKRIIVILFMIVAAAALLQAASSSKSDSIGSVFFTPSTDAKNVEDKMAEALARLESLRQERAIKESEPLTNESKEDLSHGLPGNSLNNTSIDSSLINSSLLNSSAAQVFDAPAELKGNSHAGRQNVGSSSKDSFNGFYGMTASRHEMGKSGINSKMFLSGNFEMDKTVKFQDQGVD